MCRLALWLATVALAAVCITTVGPAEAQPTPTPTSTATATATATATPTPTPTPTPTATQTVQVWIDFPDAPGVNVTLEAYTGTDFVVRTNISYVKRLKVTQYDITYNAAVVEVVRVIWWEPDVRKGKIGGQNFPVEGSSFVPQKTQGRLRVIQNIDGFDWRTGAGYMSRIFFHVNGSEGQTSPIRIDITTLDDYLLEPIRHTTFNSSVLVLGPTPTPTATPLPGDVDGNWYIEAADITKLERIILGWDDETPWADANQDGTVNLSDIGVVEYMILEIWPWNHVHIEAPDSLPHCSSFTADVFVTYVEDLSSAGFGVTYDDAVLNLTDVTGGTLMEITPGVSAEFYPVAIDDWSLTGGPGAVWVNASVLGGAGVDGAGYLARLHFHVDGVEGEASLIALNASLSWLRDSLGGDITATWEGDWFAVAP